MQKIAVKIIYDDSIWKLLEKQFQLRNKLPKSMSILPFDIDLLLERALLAETPLIKKLSRKLQTKLTILNKLQLGTKNVKLKSEKAPQLIKVKSEIKSIGRDLFKAVFSDTQHYLLREEDLLNYVIFE